MNHNNYFNLSTFLKYVRDNIITHSIFKLCITLTLICLIFAKQCKILNLLLPHSLFLFTLIYLNYIGRITEWVLNSLWIIYLISIIFLVCEHFPNIEVLRKTQKKAFIFCLCGSVLFNSEILLTRALTTQPMHGNLYHCINGISKTKNVTYFCDVTSVYAMSREYKILEKTPEHFFSNIFFSGAWFSCSPHENYTKILYKSILPFGIKLHIKRLRINIHNS